MRTIFAGLAAALILAPAAASAQYDEGGYRRPHDHVEVYRHGDHDVVVVRHHPRDYGDRPFYGERRHHHHHHDFDD